MVWSAITQQVDREGSVSEFVSVSDSERETFYKHPWILGSSDVVELKQLLDSLDSKGLNKLTTSIGYASFPGLDAFVADADTLFRQSISHRLVKKYVDGKVVRDWSSNPDKAALVPYDDNFSLLQLDTKSSWAKWLWKFRVSLGNIKTFGGKTRNQVGDDWWGWYRWIPEKYAVHFSLAFANVSTHNQFSFERGNYVYNGHAPVIKLPRGTSEDDHLALLGLLNSAIACFWMKQVFFPKGGDQVGNEGARIRKTWWDERYEFAGTGLKSFPLSKQYPKQRSKILDDLASKLSTNAPEFLIKSDTNNLQEKLSTSFLRWKEILSKIISVQEELDWECYRFYNLLDQDFTYDQEPLALQLGQRAFEIVMARQIEAGTLGNVTEKHHNSTPITELPNHWPDDYKQLVERRIQLIETNKNIRLIEQPEYKRRWNTESWESQLNRALQTWLLTHHLESYFDLDGRMNESGTPTAHPLLTTPTLISTGQLTDLVRHSEPFLQVGELYRNDPTFNVQTLVDDLIDTNRPPPTQPPLQTHRTAQTRRLGTHSEPATPRRCRRTRPTHPRPPNTPPKTSPNPTTGNYAANSTYPKNAGSASPLRRPRQDSRLLPGPADPLQIATAIANYYVRVQEDFGGTNDPRLIPLLGCLLELIPWVQQWHNDPNPDFNGLRMGDYYLSFVTDEAQQLGKTLDDIRDWQPPDKPKKTKKSKRKQ